MNIAKIEENIQKILADLVPETFIYDLLVAYGKPKASITRLQKGSLNLSKTPEEIIWKKNLLFQAVAEDDLHGVIDRLRKSELVSKHQLRFIIVTDYKALLAVDAKSGDTLDIPIGDLPKHCDFFLPWAGQEKYEHWRHPISLFCLLNCWNKGDKAMNKSLLHDVTSVKPIEGLTLWVGFDDGTGGTVDFSEWSPFPGALAPLAKPEIFAGVYIHPEYKTLAWQTPDLVDVDPVWLYCRANGLPLPTWS